MAVGRRPSERHKIIFCAIRFFILLISVSTWRRERELWMRPRALDGWGNEVLPETVQLQKNLQYLSANVRPFWRWDDQGRSRREEKRLKIKRRGPKASATASFRLLTALSLLLIIAGDVELNPGPLFTEPKLADLMNLPVAAEWRHLGLQLGVSDDELDVIQDNNAGRHNMVEQCLSFMFKWWLDNCSEPTYTKIVEALVAIGKTDVAKEISEEYGVPCDVVDRAVPNRIAAYAKSLKEKYKDLSVFPEKEWPPSVHIGHQYVNLALITHGRQEEPIEEIQEDILRGKIDKVTGNRNETNIGDVFILSEGAKRPLRILIDGAPGIGKTTLCRKITKEWACGEFLGQYSLVVLLHLREKKIRKVNRIEDLFYHDDSDLQAEVAKQVRKDQGENVFFIFDGWDELSHDERTEESLFLSIFKGEILRKCSVLVTSRPYASDQLQRLPNLIWHAEVIGFRWQEVRQCIERTITDEVQAKELIDSLRQRLDVTSLCYIPLNCAIVLYVYQKSNCSLPSTLTELFELFILHSLKRHAELTLKNHRLLRNLRNLKAVPSPLDSQLDRLCGLAFKGLEHDRLIFTEEEIESALENTDMDLEPKLLGLLTAFKSFSSTGEDITYQFLHLTIQEFLAARWVATHLSLSQQAEFFVAHLTDDRFRMMLIFLAGISKLEDASFSRVFSKEIDFLKGDSWRDHHKQEQFFFLLAHFLYESKNPIHCHTLAHATKQQSLFLSDNHHTAFYFHMLGYFLARSDCTWERLQFTSNCARRDLLQVLFTICEDTSTSLPAVKQLIISDVKESSGFEFTTSRISPGWMQSAADIPSISDLVQIVRVPAFQHLEILELCYSAEFCDKRHHAVLDYQPLRELFRAGTIRDLTLLGVPGLNDTVIKECVAPELSNCTSLNSLDIGSRAITTDGLVSLFEALKVNTSLERLYVEMPHVGDVKQLGKAVQSMLEVNTTLQVLSFINHFGLIFFPRNSMELYLRVLNALTYGNKTLKALTLVIDCSNFYTIHGGSTSYLHALEIMLLNNQSLTSLTLVHVYTANAWVHFPAALYETVARTLTINKTLQKLCIKGLPGDFVGCTVEHGLEMLFEALCSNFSLQMLAIDFSLRTLERSTFRYPVSRMINFTYNIRVITALTKMLQYNKSLRSLVMSQCILSRSQLQQIVHALTLNIHRRDINLILGEHNRLGEGDEQERNCTFIQEEVYQCIAQRFYDVCHIYDIYTRPLTDDSQQEQKS